MNAAAGATVLEATTSGGGAGREATTTDAEGAGANRVAGDAMRGARRGPAISEMSAITP